MKERPIIFSAPMVRAILDGRKTQTRRIIKPQPQHFHDNSLIWKGDVFWQNGSTILDEDSNSPCPYGVAGDRLWVREKWRPCRPVDTYYAIQYGDESYGPFGERVGIKKYDGKWRSSIHMPRWASRITLEITKVRVERLQDISREDAIAEGVEWNKSPTFQTIEQLERDIRGGMSSVSTVDYIGGYHQLCDSLYGKGAWEKNPWVWVIDLRVRQFPSAKSAPVTRVKERPGFPSAVQLS